MHWWQRRGVLEACLVIKRTGKGKENKPEKAEKKALKHIFRIKPGSQVVALCFHLSLHCLSQDSPVWDSISSSMKRRKWRERPWRELEVKHPILLRPGCQFPCTGHCGQSTQQDLCKPVSAGEARWRGHPGPNGCFMHHSLCFKSEDKLSN